MRELTRTEAIDLVGRDEAENELPERLRADVRMLGALLGRVLRESGPRALRGRRATAPGDHRRLQR
jgi:phosphoenolpyruvate carboxylase